MKLRNTISPGVWLPLVFAVANAMGTARAQGDLIDRIDKSDDKRTALYLSIGRAKYDKLALAASGVLDTVQVRVRLTTIEPAGAAVMVQHRIGGEGLGGISRSGNFVPPDRKQNPWRGGLGLNDIPKVSLPLNEWSAPVSLKTITGDQPIPDRCFFTLAGMRMVPSGVRVNLEAPQALAFELEFSTEDDQVFKTVTQSAPRGGSATFLLSGVPILLGLVRQGYLTDPTEVPLHFDPKLFPDFAESVQGLSTYVHERYARTAKTFPLTDPLPKKIGIVGRVAGFGINGYAVRHSDPAIIRDEVETLRLLGINGLARVGGAYDRSDSVLPFAEFPRLAMGVATGIDNHLVEKLGSPLAPGIAEAMTQTALSTLAARAGEPVDELWSITVDEPGVILKDGIDTLPDSIAEYREYLRANRVLPQELGVPGYELAKPYAIWIPGAKGAPNLAPVPASRTDRLNYYYTYRFMSYLTGKFYAPAAAKTAGNPRIRLYSQMQPTPSWGGGSLDWHEYYDQKPVNLLMFETSNRDPRVWQWESYLGDIMRGIGQRHDWPLAALIKPHRGAPIQRMATLLARGARGFEWYTYGPEYAKGDSWAGNPYLIDFVGRAARFAGKVEPYVYEARWLHQPEVAFVLPRSSEVWMATGTGDTSLEDAKWVYTALNHEHIPVDVLSEQQLIEGKAKDYKILYVVGANLHHEAVDKVIEWVQHGGVLWTDFGGLVRDEANEKSSQLGNLLGLGERPQERWGYIPGYGSTSLIDIKNTKPVPENIAINMASGAVSDALRAVAARELWNVPANKEIQILASFADGHPAMIRHQFGQGAVYVVATYAGGAYSARVRRPDYDMNVDYDPLVRQLVTAPALDLRVCRPAVPAAAAVEAIALNKDGRRSVMLINWAYKGGWTLATPDNLRIALPGVGDFKSVRSSQSGPLTIEGTGESRSVVLPTLGEADLLILE